jgi:DJ-1 family protein
MKTALLLVADGSEEIETTATFDILVRCGVAVTVASCSPSTMVKLSRGFSAVADTTIESVAAAGAVFDAIIVPGGMPGAANIGGNATFVSYLRSRLSDDARPLAVLAAICAAPAVALLPHGFLDGVTQVTCFPALKGKMSDAGKTWCDTPVLDQSLGSNKTTRLVLSQGPFTTFKFGLAIAALLVGDEVAQKVAQAMLVPSKL